MSNRPRLPSFLSLLYVSAAKPPWAMISVNLGAHGCDEPHYRWVNDARLALNATREESFDVILMVADSNFPVEQARTLLETLRNGGDLSPVIILTRELTDRVQAELREQRAEVLITEKNWYSEGLIGMIRLAIDRFDERAEADQLRLSAQRQMIRESDEAERILGQQRQLLASLRNGFTQLDDVPDEQSPTWPDELRQLYTELLRTHVIMGDGRLETEVEQFSEILVAASISPKDALKLHVECVEELVNGLGNRSTRHVMARADLLALELSVLLGGNYFSRVAA